MQAYEVAARSALSRRASAITASLAFDNVPAPYSAHANELEGQYAERCSEAVMEDPLCVGWKVDSSVFEECVSNIVCGAARRRWKEDLRMEKEAEDVAAKDGAEGSPPLSSLPNIEKYSERERGGDKSTTPVEEFDEEAHADDEDDGEDDEDDGDDEDATDHDGATEDDEDGGAGDNDNDGDEPSGENGKDNDEEVDVAGAVAAVAVPKRPRMVRLGGHKTATSKAGATTIRKRKLGGGGAEASKPSISNGVTGGAALQGNKRRRNAGGSGGRSRSGRGRGRRSRGGAGRSGT
mmetsp:Transcript_39166/g.117760  ORF Transcript_39166/g.117760 Transcript_39166/m.117760 type:complete len:293 (+) Transcript_39166:235-1113(+)